MARIDLIRGALFLAGVILASAPALAHDSHAHHAKPATTAADASPCFETERNYFTDLPLVTHEGRTVRFFDDVLYGRTVLISFIYTECEDACPLITAKMIQAGERFRSTGTDPISLLSISVAPANDTPEALARFAAKLGPPEDWTLLTGDADNIRQVLSRLGQHAEDPRNHTVVMLAGNVNARRWVKIPPTDGPDQIAQRLRLLASAKTAEAACGS